MLSTLTKFALSYDYNYTSPVASPPDAATGGLLIFSGVWLFFWLIVGVLMVVSMWKMFTKAGKPGWASIIPIYNLVVMLQILGRPVWWILLFFIPFVNIVMAIIISIDTAKAYGKDPVFAIVLLLFPYVGYPILGFGSAKYVGPVAKPAA